MAPGVISPQLGGNICNKPTVRWHLIQLFGKICNKNTYKNTYIHTRGAFIINKMALVKKREAITKALTALLKWANDAGSRTTLVEAEDALANLEAQYAEFKLVHQEILDVTGRAELPFQEIEFVNADRIYNDASSVFKRLIARLKLEQPSTSAAGKRAAATSGSASTPSTVTSNTVAPPKVAGPAQPPADDNQQNRIARKSGTAIAALLAWSDTATLENTTVVSLTTRFEMLEKYWQAFQAATFSDWTVDLDDAYYDVENNYVQARDVIQTLLDESARPEPADVPRNHAADAARVEIQLPRIQIPKFSGDLHSWPAFHDLFTSMVHEARNLSGVQKMHYLRSSLEGEAEQLIRSLKVTEANYREAWDVLLARYNQRRVIIDAHLDQLLDMPKVNIESASGLRLQMDTFHEAVRALSALGQQVDTWDAILIRMLLNKIDSETKRAWEMSLGNDILPTYDELRDFIERRCRSLQALHQSSSSTKPQRSAEPRTTTSKPNRQQNAFNNQRPFSSNSASVGCTMCKGAHAVGSCPDFIRLAPGERYRKACELRLCYNCLKPDHITSACSAGSCRTCHRRHHSLLHYDEEKPARSAPAAAAHLGVHDSRNVLLATAVAFIHTAQGVPQRVRILLDNGSQSSFITDRCCKYAGLARRKASIPVTGVGAATAAHTRGRVTFTLQSTNGENQHSVDAFVLQKITGTLPSTVADTSSISFLPLVSELADPEFNQPGEIDVLLGADVLGGLMLPGTHHDTINKALHAQNTTLGWIIAGPIAGSTRKLQVTISINGADDLDRALQRFWQLESVDTATTQTSEELACEEHFRTTHQRDGDGRFIVQLPFRENAPTLGDSKSSAVKSLQHLERRFIKNPELKTQYTNFIDEYLQLGHMSLITHDVEEHRSFYLPHHPVFKMSSTSTKIRVVFDASRKTNTGASLNNTLMVGPKLQGDLIDTLLRFRSHSVAFCGDLVKMYRQVRTVPSSSEFQRILWRADSRAEMRTYRLDTVTYGTASASYLATKALQQLAHDEMQRYPLASAVAMSDFYVDDLMTGCDTVHDALQLQDELIKLMAAGGFTLSKWASNSNALLESVSESEREVNCPLEIHLDDAIKTLGLVWNPSIDCFQYRVASPKSNVLPTKRIVLSEVATLFDPLGLLAPLIVSAKIYLQALWAEGVAWDEPLSAALADRWHSYCQALEAIHSINIPRWLGIHSSRNHQLHGFCDASEAAYAAVVYVRSADSTDNVMVRIVTARTKVSPIQKISVPRLELCGAVLLARLMAHVKSALRQPNITCYAWCDSTVTLAWIRKPSHCWQTFVANRVSTIQSLAAPEIWHHVPGPDNPADVASRGLTATALAESKIWWHGPEWLPKPEAFWPRTRVECTTHIDERATLRAMHTNTEPNYVLHRFSSFGRLCRVTARMHRFAFNCRHPKQRSIGPITIAELTESENHWVRVSQACDFYAEIACCKQQTPVESKSVLRSLNPFVDNDGILRVGGRLANADMPYSACHPIILAKGCHLSTLLVDETHRKNLHSGTQLTIATLRQKFWILSVRSVVKHHIHGCKICIRHRHTRAQQLMASLPKRRTEPARAFLHSGVDYAGPFTIKLQPGRGTKTSKAYIALFVCFATRAVHLELVSSLTSDAFLAAFRRFVARRGRCAHLHSDCGTNFVGACKELRLLQDCVTKQFQDTTLASSLATDGTQWHFNPPGAPNFGGLWEAGVKSVKHHMRRVLGTSLLTFEELYTVLTQIEAVLNSRPICPLTDDVNDLQALTPGHFLIGEAMNTAPDPTVPSKTAPTHRWQHLQLITQHFWQRWRQEYVSAMQQRFKWSSQKDNIQIGTLALIVDELLPPAKWSLGRVIEVHPGTDGLVRVVTVRHQNGIFKRPVSKLCIFTDT